MINSDSFFDFIKNTELEQLKNSVCTLTQKNISENGNVSRWLSALEKIPKIDCDCFEENGKVVISSNENTDNSSICVALREFMPWRKGPWKILNIDIDTEWNSDLKWKRFAKFCDFSEKKILDIGCGNGYYAYRAALNKAKFVIGVDPSIYSVFQAQIFAKLCPQIPVWIFPLAQKNLPQNLPFFDVIFSMGVIYHHKDPIEHLSHIYDLLVFGGELILETLVADDCDFPDGLKPKGRYAKMRNVYEIPSIEKVKNLLNSLNFKEIKLLDVTKTTNAEQRKTDWMTFESLEDFIDENDNSKTIEGYPAPTRAVFWARK
ncbi:MAG: tRNA 5-methoxyuridine(34)/uridine 5-oxyacetic acid(34) synthase CmoB [Chitinispirillales bacterium]|nr:tRNA 5-methoxyuridine(34)/uridine 5-oxyacetic acid(34) synthase CmoB [Chitinispirillales bacterium]